VNYDSLKNFVKLIGSWELIDGDPLLFYDSLSVSDEHKLDVSFHRDNTYYHGDITSVSEDNFLFRDNENHHLWLDIPWAFYYTFKDDNTLILSTSVESTWYRANYSKI